MSHDHAVPYQFTLPNGLRCVHLESGRNVGHCGLLIEAGSRDELADENGLAHFIEHTLFKGTKKRRTFHILNRLDSVGADLNAYTSKEETWITASFLIEHLERAMELISDIAFAATFPEKEIVKERDVIIDEIHAWRDNPGDAIFDEFEEMLYPAHALGRNILGTEDSVTGFGREDILRFIGRQYRNDRLVFSSVGAGERKENREALQEVLFCCGHTQLGNHARCAENLHAPAARRRPCRASSAPCGRKYFGRHGCQRPHRHPPFVEPLGRARHERPAEPQHPRAVRHLLQY